MLATRKIGVRSGHGTESTPDPESNRDVRIVCSPQCLNTETIHIHPERRVRYSCRMGGEVPPPIAAAIAIAITQR